MRLSLVTETFPPEVNGVAMTLGRLVGGLRQGGWSVQVVRPRQTIEGPGGGDFLVSGFPIPFYRSLRFGAPVTGVLRRAWTEQKPDLVHIATEGPLGWAALRAARQLGLPVTSSFHTNFHHYGGHYGLSLVRPLALRYLRWFHNRTSLTLAPTAALCRELEGAGFRNTGVMSRGVDATLFSPERRSAATRTSWGAAEADPVLLYVGRLAAEKNLSVAVEAFLRVQRLVPQARFVLVGDGPEAAALKKAHPDFIFAGTRRGEDLAVHYASADVFLFPSLTETFGNVVTEAMASGLVVVAFDYAAAEAHLKPSQAGWTPAFGDTQAFHAAVVGAVQARDQWPERRRRARAAGEQLSWDLVIQRFAADLNTVARAAKSA